MSNENFENGIHNDENVGPVQSNQGIKNFKFFIVLKPFF